MKVSVIFVIYEGKKYIKPAFDAVFAQTHRDLEVIAVINKSTDGAKEEIQNNYPQVKVIDPGQNLFFAKANNVGIAASTGEFIQLVNQDVVLEPDYIAQMLKVFSNPTIASATGKVLRYDFNQGRKLDVVDTLGIVMAKSGRARDISQNQKDTGQFEAEKEIFGASGAVPMYRKSALEKVKYQQEYFDEDFVMYWEDVDLAWRLQTARFKSMYVPKAVAYHGRTAGQSEGGYLHLFKFIRHHSRLSRQVLKWNYKNHFLMYIKNTKYIHPAFVIREIAMLGYIIVFETPTLKVVPELLRQLPKIWKKRQWIYQS